MGQTLVVKIDNNADCFDRYPLTSIGVEIIYQFKCNAPDDGTYHFIGFNFARAFKEEDLRILVDDIQKVLEKK